MPFISATNRITLWPQEFGGRTRLLGRRRPASALKAAGPIRSKCDNHRTWRGASSGILCISINMKFGPAHKPESERALWPAASSGGAWNSLLGSEPLERRDLDRFGSEGVVVVFCLLKDRPYALTPEILGCVLDFSAAKDRPETRFGSCVSSFLLSLS